MQTGAAWSVGVGGGPRGGAGAPARERERQGRPGPSPNLLCPLSWPPGASKGRQRAAGGLPQARRRACRRRGETERGEGKIGKSRACLQNMSASRPPPTRRHRRKGGKDHRRGARATGPYLSPSTLPTPLVVHGGSRLMAGGEGPGEWGCRKFLLREKKAEGPRPRVR